MAIAIFLFTYYFPQSLPYCAPIYIPSDPFAPKMLIARREDWTHGASKGNRRESILNKWQDNGATHAPNCRIKVNKKKLDKNKRTYVINDLVAYVILCS